MEKQIKQLGYKIPKYFFRCRNYNIYKIDESVIKVVNTIREYATDVLKNRWMADNITKIAYVVNAIDPVGLFMDIGKEGEEFSVLYCNSNLDNEEARKAMYLIRNSLCEFIDKHTEGIEQFREGSSQ